MVDLLLTQAQRGDLGRQSLVRTEVLTHGVAHADLLLLEKERLIAIEVKRSQWRRAILQALLNRYFADESYVALWESRIGPAIIDEATRYGVGVISLSHRRATIRVPAPSTTPHPSLREQVLARLGED